MKRYLHRNKVKSLDQPDHSHWQWKSLSGNARYYTILSWYQAACLICYSTASTNVIWKHHRRAADQNEIGIWPSGNQNFSMNLNLKHWQNTKTLEMAILMFLVTCSPPEFCGIEQASCDQVDPMVRQFLTMPRPHPYP